MCARCACWYHLRFCTIRFRNALDPLVPRLHLYLDWGTDPSDRLAQPPPVGATVYACYGCWVIAIADDRRNAHERWSVLS
jgi:hypothetical protein